MYCVHSLPVYKNFKAALRVCNKWTNFWCKIAQSQALIHWRRREELKSNREESCTQQGELYLKPQGWGNIWDTMPRGACTQSCLSPLLGGLNVLCAQLACLQKLQSSIEDVQYMDTNFWCKIAQSQALIHWR